MRVKARIVSGLKRNNGACAAEWLHRFAYGKRARFIGRHALKAHIWQLRKTGLQITAQGRGRHPVRWLLE